MGAPSGTGDDPVLQAWHRVGVGVAALLLAAAVATASFQAGYRRAPAPTPVPAPTAAAAPALPKETIGWVDAPADELIVGDTVAVNGWALDPAGIRGVEIRVGDRAYPARFGLPRPDVAAEKPGYPDGAANGFAFTGSIPDLTAQRHELAVVAIAKDGRETVLARKALVPPAARAMWSDLLAARPAHAAAPFSFLMMTSGLAVGGAVEIDTQYRGYPSRTQRVGMAIPVLYMRIDAGCGRRLGVRSGVRPGAQVRDEERRRRQPRRRDPARGEARVAGAVHPQRRRLGRCELRHARVGPQRPARGRHRNCQWSQNNRTLPDDYLKGLAGSTESPELARTLTYNVYATKVRHYKQRNLQAAAAHRRVVRARAPGALRRRRARLRHLHEPVLRREGVFDYNPGTLRQFRDWLAAAVPMPAQRRRACPTSRPTGGASR